ncbi:MAG: hypothetical protein POELPBGB_03276 [Bacteroidia bacterium]|nr:hypothetical protein [Bacteroidia bacterium]
MNEKMLKIIFLLIFAFSFVSVITGLHMYPAVRFPQFPNKKMGKQISYYETKLFSRQQKKEVDLMEIIQPYDKQYYLFSLRALSNEKASQNMLSFINHLYQNKYNTTDSLYIISHPKTVIMP